MNDDIRSDSFLLNRPKTKTPKRVQKNLAVILEERPDEAQKPSLGQEENILNEPSLPALSQPILDHPCNQGKREQGKLRPEGISLLKDSPRKETPKKFGLETIPQAGEAIKTPQTPLREPSPSSDLPILAEEDGMNEGYIKIWRKLLHSQAWQNPPLLKVWLWCLLRASHNERWVPLKTGRGTTEVKLFPGQFIFGRNTAAKELEMKPSSVRNYIAKLRNLKNLNVKQDTQEDTQNHGRQDRLYSIISIINWEIYQGNFKKLDSQKDGQLNTQEDRQEDNQRTTKGHKQELKKKKKYILRDSANPALGVLSYLNEKTGRHYRDASHIEARLKGGATPEECKAVIDKKLKDEYFIKNPKYLNPETLFRKSHWDKYLNEPLEVKPSW